MDKKRIFLLIIYILIAALLLTGCKKDESAVADEDTTKIAVNSKIQKIETSDKINERIFEIKDAYSVAIQFNSIFPVSGFEIMCSNLSDINDENGKLSLSLYKFDINFSNTVRNSNLIVEQTFEDFEDKTLLMIKTDPQPAGEYMILISKGHGKVGIMRASNASEKAGNNILYYENGLPIYDCVYSCNILFSTDKSDGFAFFNPCSETLS